VVVFATETYFWRVLSKMNSESKVVAELWDLVRDHIPASRRLEIAISFLQKFEEYGFDPRDMQDIIDEDVYLRRAFVDLFEDEEENEEDEYGDD
jgi:hypothetical protein